MASFAERFKKLRNEKGVTQRELAKLLSIGASTIGMYETGQRQPDPNTLKFIAEYFNVSTDYLLGRTDHPRVVKMAEAEMFRRYLKDTEARSRVINTPQSGKASTLNQLLGEDPVDYVVVSDRPNTLRIPILGTIAAGQPLYAQENIIGYEDTSIDDIQDGEYFYLIVKGDSMTGSRIHPGDKVLVKVTPDICPNDIAVVLIDNQDATLKKVQSINGQVILSSTNPEYSPMVINKGEVRIIGKVTKVVFEPK